MRFASRYAFAAAMALASCWVVAPPPAAADTVDGVDATYRQWMAKHGVDKGVLALTYRSRLVLNRGYGALQADNAVHVASLSKAITAVCIAKLVDAGKLSFDTRIGDALAAFFKKSGDPVDGRIKQRTVTDLLAHRLGYDKDSDPAWGKVFFEFLRHEGADKPNIDKLLTYAMRIKMPYEPGSAYRYANVHYLMLGAMIEEATGQSYEKHCRETVLEPLGIAGARLNPVWAIRSSSGGWMLSAAQYLRFFGLFASDADQLGVKAAAYLADGADKWLTDKKDAYYGLGVWVRPLASGRNIWHTGALEFSPGSTLNPALRADLGTYVYKNASDTTWFAYYQPKPADAAVSELGQALNRAIGAIKQWPAEDLYAGTAKN